MKIKVIESDEEFKKLQDDWDKLAQNPTNSFEWSYKWWKHQKQNNELKIITVYKGNEICGIAPLYIQNTRALKLLPFRKLRFIGGEISDYLGFLIKQGHERDLIFRVILKYVLRSFNFDQAEFNQINSSHPDFDLWEKYLNTFAYKLNQGKVNYKISLNSFNSYEEYYHSLSKKFRKTLRHILNKASKNKEKMEFLFEQFISDEDFDAVAEINIKRNVYLYNQGNHKRDSYYADINHREFIKDYFCSHLSDSFILAKMKYEDKLIAYLLILRRNDTLYFWNAAFDVDYKLLGPSTLVMNQAIKFAFENNYKYVDFLRGDEKYKLNWANTSFNNFNLVKNKSFKAKIISLYRENMPKFILNKLRPKNIKIIKYNPTLEEIYESSKA